MADMLDPTPIGSSAHPLVPRPDEPDEKLAPQMPSQLSLSPLSDRDEEASASGLPPTSPVSVRLRRWNESKTTTFRFFFTLYAFIIMGMNDGAIGVRIDGVPPDD